MIKKSVEISREAKLGNIHCSAETTGSSVKKDFKQHFLAAVTFTVGSARLAMDHKVMAGESQDGR